MTTCSAMESGEQPPSDEPMIPQPQASAEPPPPRPPAAPTRFTPIPPAAAPAAATTTPTASAAAATAAAADGSSDSVGFALAAAGTSAEAAAAGSSPAALLVTSLVRSRATYFERLSSGSRASASAGTACSQSQPECCLAPAGCPPIPRHATALAAHPLHPLAPHPLSAFSRSTVAASAWRRRSDDERHQQQQPLLRRSSASGSAIDDDDGDSVDTFFDKPSYTCYGAAVELAPASSYGGGGGASRHSSAAPEADPSSSSLAASLSLAAAAAAPGGGCIGSSADGNNPAAVGPAAPDSVSGGGFVRCMSAHFARVSSGGRGGGSGSAATGLDGLFDEFLTHVGTLLSSHPDVEAQMDAVQGLSYSLSELQARCETLGRKEDEVEHLRGVLRELTTTRAEAIRLKVQMAESLNGLQQEYYKVLRSAQMAQGTCKQHSIRATAARKQLLETQGDLGRYKRAVASLRDRNRRLRLENEELAARLQALEGGRGLAAEGHRSASYMTLLQAQTPVLY